MGSCQSHRAAVAPDSLHKPMVECRRGSNEFFSCCAPFEALDALGMACWEPPEQSLESDLQHHHIGNTANPKEPILSSTQSYDVPPRKPRSKHARTRSGRIKDYLQAEGPSSNRVMVHFETQPIEDVYDGVHDGEELGEGIAGKVRRITHRNTGIQRALKRLDLRCVTRDEDLDRLLDEIKIMCCLDHPNVVCLEEVFEGKHELFLTQELCEGRDLFDRLECQPNYRFTEVECARLVKQIINSVSYLHSKDIIHRDLKLENFLFQDETDESVLKIIDFGLSKHFTRGEKQHETVGTPYTVAPEVIRCKGYDEKCDVWGIGVIAYLLLSGETPFGGDCADDDLKEVKKNILSGKVSFESSCWENVSKLAVSFIKPLLQLDPQERPSASELQRHPWLKSNLRSSSFASDESLSVSVKVINGLVSFKDLSSTRKFLREIISFTLLPDQISGLREEFDKIDVDGKGEISLSCFKEALVVNSDQHPFSESEIKDIFNGLKVRNTDLSVRWHEFIAACLSQCHIDDRNIRLAFDRIDEEHKGFITLKDLKRAMEFYGSDTHSDLQSTWINNIIDYKCDKQHMTYDDYYRLLTLDTDQQLEAAQCSYAGKQLFNSTHGLCRFQCGVDRSIERQLRPASEMQLCH